MQNTPTVSVIIPNYNHEAFLDERIQSVLNQTYKDYEIILLDDASTDNSVEILKKYSANKKITQFIINKKNSGSPFRQWKKGIEMAKGEFIWIAESDDSCEPIFIEKLMDSFRKDIVLAYCASKMVTEKGKILGLDPWSEGKINPRWTKNYYNNGLDEIHNNLRYINTIPNASAVIFKKDTIKDIDIPLNMQFCGDWYLWTEILKNGNIAFLSSPLNNFRAHKQTTRAIGDYRREEKRIKEYIFIIKKNSITFERIKNAAKYGWLVNEILRNKGRLKSFSVMRLGLPSDFLSFYLRNLFKNHYSRLKMRVRELLLNRLINK